MRSGTAGAQTELFSILVIEMRDIPDLKTGDPMSNGLGGVCGVASGPSFPEPYGAYKLKADNDTSWISPSDAE